MTNRPVLLVLVLTLGCHFVCYSVRPIEANGEPLSASGWNAHKEAEVTNDGRIIPERDVFIFDTLSQGKAEIDELDYYNIAGDEQAVATLIDWRTKTNNANMVTYAGLGACSRSASAQNTTSVDIVRVSVDAETLNVTEEIIVRRVETIAPPRAR